MQKIYASLQKEVCVTEDEFREDTAALRAVIIKLFSAVMLFSRHYSELKEKQNAYDFSDISHMALALLVSRNDDDTVDRTELAKELSHKYTEILIDEYQDTNKAQDMLFRAISDNEENLSLSVMLSRAYTASDLQCRKYFAKTQAPSRLQRQKLSCQNKS